MSKFTFLLLFFTKILMSFAWDAIGHSITANLAFSQLPKSHSYYFRRYLNASSNETFAQAAIWPDALRLQTQAYNHWHYKGNCLVKDPNINCSIPNVSAENSFTVIQDAIKILTNISESLEKQSFYFKFLLHVLGDIHQPLHNIWFFSSKYPKGDKGGNRIMINYHNITDCNLHRFWDNLCHIEQTFRVAKNFHFQNMKITKDLKKNTTFSGNFNEIAKWMDESYNIAVRYVYDDDILADGKLKLDYVIMCRSICYQQIIRGGLRLSSILDYIWKSVMKSKQIKVKESGLDDFSI